MKKKKGLSTILIIITLVFICSYVVSQSGYYEYSMQSRKNLTEEEIKQFEADVKAGNDIDITDYLKDREVDYTNKLTRATVRVSTTVNDYLKKGIETVFRMLNQFVES